MIHFRKKLFVVLLFIGGNLLFMPSWSNPFVLDDLTKIHSNVDLQIPFALRNFTYSYRDSHITERNDPSRPLTYMIYWLCWQIGDGSPTPFHIANAMVHALTAMALAFFANHIMLMLFGQFSLIAGVLAACLFLTSPLMAGTVAYASGLSDLLGGLFTLLTLLPLVCKPRHSPGTIALSCFFYSLALASKQSVIIIPALLLTIDYVSGQLKGRMTTYLPLLLISAAFLAWRQLYLGGIGDLEGRDQVVPALEYLSSQGIMILKYLSLSVFPFGLSADHRYFPTDFSAWQAGFAWLAVLSMTVIVFRLARRSPLACLIGVGWTLFLLSLLPTSSLFPTVDLFVERRAYNANFGLCLIVGGVLWTWWQHGGVRKKSAALFFLTAVSLQIWQTLQRQRVYSSPESLWQEALALDPENPRALVNLGVHYSAVNRFEESRQVLEQLLKMQPESQNGTIYSKLAYIFQQKTYAQHDLNKAWSYYEKALSLSPDNVFAVYNAGTLLFERGDYANAEHFFLRATQLNPQLAKGFLGAAQAALKQNNKAAAEKWLIEAQRLDSTLIAPQ